ncbi:Na/Pi cotransporter family protein [Thioalbus denitrificans]|uniref:Phosphate:Na+ symporter n=1 Tax=Thioalbus denitrificans TaxID=547122 RepID=A0A369C4A5_9GAMM|nr:Na/Pi cotransporter family protein [Thioalbus denitrificans]RCX28391.1 phosphate:Na+ symporter [Thioalbus denitrificans]
MRKPEALAALLLAIAASPALGAATEASLDWWQMSMQLLGGLALFLFGMEQMAEALKAVAGDGLKVLLARLTGNRVMGLFTGAAITAIIQSSSVTTVMLVGFVSAGLMSLSQAVGVILGADIGTTITAQIVAFKVTRYALLLVAAGFLMNFAGRAEALRQYGQLTMGLGLIFFGMGLMSDGMRPLRDYEPFIALMQGFSHPLYGILAATLFTGLVQSSSATMGVVIAMATQGLVNLEAGIALALGANIGTCMTAGLAAIGKPREAVRVAVAHVTFKVAGVLLVVGFIPELAQLVRSVSPAADDLAGLERLAAETPRQIANAHTLFNVGLALLFLPAASFFARFCEWVVPDRPLQEEEVVRARYLDSELLSTPSLALDGVRLEIGHMGQHVQAMLDQMLPALLTGSRASLRRVAGMDDAVDTLHGAVVTYLGQISKRSLTNDQTRDFMHLMEAANDLENIGDVIETDLVALGEKRLQVGLHISRATQEVLTGLHAVVAETVTTALRAVADRDPEAAAAVIARKREFNRLVGSASRHEVHRLVATEPNRLPAYRMEVDVIEKLKRIYYFAKRLAKTVVVEEDDEGEE